MGMLAERADHVIGVDTHRDAHSVAAVATATGSVTAQTTVAADPVGFRRLLRFARGMPALGVCGRLSPAAATVPA